MNVQQARNQSLAFYLAYQRCMEERPLLNGDVQWLVAPAIVSAAFSIEVGFKALILRTGKSPSGHELEKLFGALDQSVQSSLRKKVGFTDTNFDTSLRSVNKAFVEWRYVYELASAQADLEFLKQLAEATQDELGP
jgi:hypothetical protein